MPLNLTEEQIIQLAPDAASVKAGKGLAVPGKWVLLACSERAVWGHCQGSGKNPYQTAIDLNDIAFKCSCPSRKFPCKHGLGLLLLFAAQADLFEKAEEPEWGRTGMGHSLARQTRGKSREERTESPERETGRCSRTSQTTGETPSERTERHRRSGNLDEGPGTERAGQCTGTGRQPV